MPEIKQYICNGPVRHNGKRYRFRQPIDLDKKFADPLVEADAISPLVESDAASAPKVTDEQMKLSSLVLAIAELETENDEHFTAEGKPQVKALESKVGFDIDAALRDHAFELFNKQDDIQED